MSERKLNENETMRTHAQQQGLFVIRATDDSISVINDEEFVPRVFPSTKPVLS
ncbi:MAG: hypothetical protein OXI88_17175 [Gammaproteobacteria bacterium]|nr:hypothetical protein [Gammaproteobacteria bacterium]MDE0513504.1 hypothetical protein [Gammaproteobacteria bacterium]